MYISAPNANKDIWYYVTKYKYGPRKCIMFCIVGINLSVWVGNMTLQSEVRISVV